MHCNQVLLDNDLENSIKSNTWDLEHNVEELQEIMYRIMPRIMSIITSALIRDYEHHDTSFHTISYPIIIISLLIYILY